MEKPGRDHIEARRCKKSVVFGLLRGFDNFAGFDAAGTDL